MGYPGRYLRQSPGGNSGQKGKLVLTVLLLLIGVGILLYPTVSNFINRRHGSYAIQVLQQHLENADIAQQRHLAEEYNAGLLAAQEGLEETYWTTLDIADGMIGSLQIPKINADLPIYHGVEEETLSKGVGHLPESAFPIGGEGNHAVLTGHTGLPSAELFTDLAELAEGDCFYISVLGDTLAYEVDQIKVVLPSEGQDLAAVPGKDYCTLVTCTPYGVNSHRLLVRGHRVEMQNGNGEQEIQEKTQNISVDSVKKLIAVAMLLPLILSAVLFPLIRYRKKKR